LRGSNVWWGAIPQPLFVQFIPMSLRSFLDSHRTTESDWHLTGMGKDVGKYSVEDEEYDQFLKLVQGHIFGPTPAASSLLERHREVGPLLVDLDFRYPSGGPLIRRYEDRHVRKFVAHLMAAMIFMTEVENRTQPIRFYMMTKPSPETEKGIHKDGIHIQCPDIHSAPRFQYALRGFLLNRGVIGSVFGSSGLSNPPEDCYDVRVIHHNNWFLYGACKPDKAQYAVKHCWRINPSDIADYLEGSAPADFDELVDAVHDLMEEDVDADMMTALTPYDRNGEFLRLLSIRRGVGISNTSPIRSERSKEWEDLLAVWGTGKAKPETRLNTLQNYTVPQNHGRDDSSDNEEDMVVATHTEEARRVTSECSAEDVALAYRIARQCLNPQARANNYNDWVNLAICLRNIANTDESYRVWVEISRRVPGYESRMTDAEYRSKWNLIRDDNSKRLGMGSLMHWAREDAPKTLETIRSENNRDWIMTYSKDTHVNVASFVCRLYAREFRCSVGSKKGHEWFHFPPDGHSWKHLRTPNELRARLSAEVRNHYIEADREFGRRIQISLGNEGEGKMLEERRKKILQIERQLEMASFKDSVLKECGEKFYDEDFLFKMNCNPNIVGVANGVLDLRYRDSEDGRERVHFRKGMPEDNLSFVMGRSEPDLDPIPYIEWSKIDPMERRELEAFFERIYPEPVLRRYVLTLLSSCLEGTNREQRFYVNQGRGSNGKSMIQTLMRYTFGDYQTSLQTTALTRKRPESGAANPDMIVTKCRRYIYMGEPDQGEKLNTSRMKQLSGEDIVEARGLFADQEKFKMMGKIFLACNDLPPVNSMDNGTWRRLRVIPHISTFVDPEKPIDPENYIFHKDLQLEYKLRKWRVAFLSMMVHYFDKEYLVHGLREPESVMEASNKYKEENDTFHSFLSEKFAREPGAGPLGIATIMDAYKQWKKDQSGRAELKRGEIIERLRQVCDKKSTNREFWGIRLLEQGEDESDAGSVGSRDLLQTVVP
jgi:P4 family phage/plasmid primase-like protien